MALLLIFKGEMSCVTKEIHLQIWKCQYMVLSEEGSLQILSVISTCFPAPCLSSWVVVVQPGRFWVWSRDLFVCFARRSHVWAALMSLSSPCSLLGLFVQDYATTDWRRGKMNNYLIEEPGHCVTTVTTICLHRKSWVNTKSPRLCVICNSSSLMSLTSDHPLVCSVCLFKIVRHLIQELPSSNN